MTAAAISSERSFCVDPFFAFPTAVRAAATITASRCPFVFFVLPAMFGCLPSNKAHQNSYLDPRRSKQGHYDYRPGRVLFRCRNRFIRIRASMAHVPVNIVGQPDQENGDNR